MKIFITLTLGAIATMNSVCKAKVPWYISLLNPIHDTTSVAPNEYPMSMAKLTMMHLKLHA